MNRAHHTNPTPDDLPPDLADLADALDRLAGAERRCAPPSLEVSVARAVAALLHPAAPAEVAGVAARADRLGAAERNSAPAELEVRVAGATADRIAAARGPKEDPACRPVAGLTVRSRTMPAWARGALAAAASLLVAGGAYFAAVGTGGNAPTPGPTPPVGPPGVSLADAAAEFDALLEILDSGYAMDTVPTTDEDTGAETDPAWVRELIEQESL